MACYGDSFTFYIKARDMFHNQQCIQDTIYWQNSSYYIITFFWKSLQCAAQGGASRACWGLELRWRDPHGWLTAGTEEQETVPHCRDGIGLAVSWAVAGTKTFLKSSNHNHNHTKINASFKNISPLISLVNQCVCILFLVYLAILSLAQTPNG
jgi:hypothetical protein